ncbi:MAG: AraC family transcriptional regulator [Polyangiaceae bacterium]
MVRKSSTTAAPSPSEESRVQLHDLVQLRVRRWPELPGFEQWHIQSAPGSSLRVIADRIMATSQAPGGAINCVAQVRGRVTENRPDVTQMYNPGDLHVQLRLHAPESYYLATFDPDRFAHLTLEAGISGPPALDKLQLANPALVTALSRLHAVLERVPDPLARQEAFAQAVQSLVVHAVGVTPPRRGAPQRSLARARELIEDRYDETLTLDDLARHAGLSQEHLVRAFSRAFGLPPHTYLMTVRVARARAMLARGRPGGEVAAACGFCDQAHMVRQFRQQMGTAPSAFGTSPRSRPGSGRPSSERRP